jgi:hypothetical protein
MAPIIKTGASSRNAMARMNPKQLTPIPSSV